MIRTLGRFLGAFAVLALGSSAVLAQTQPAAGGKSLYERIGGEAAVKAVVDDFVALAAADPKVNFTRKGTEDEWEATDENVAKFKKHLVQFLSMAFGAEVKYEGEDMKEVHEGMGITADEFAAIAADLKAALEKNKVPQAELDEIMKIAASTADMIVEKK